MGFFCFIEDGVKAGESCTSSAPREERLGMAGGLHEDNGQRGGSEDTMGPRTLCLVPTGCSPALQLQPSILETNMGYESEITSAWQVALRKSHPCPEPQFLQL